MSSSSPKSDNCVIGRRPAGLPVASTSQAGSGLGAYFADAARLKRRRSSRSASCETSCAPTVPQTGCNIWPDGRSEMRFGTPGSAQPWRVVTVAVLTSPPWHRVRCAGSNSLRRRTSSGAASARRSARSSHPFRRFTQRMPSSRPRCGALPGRDASRRTVLASGCLGESPARSHGARGAARQNAARHLDAAHRIQPPARARPRPARWTADHQAKPGPFLINSKPSSGPRR